MDSVAWISLALNTLLIPGVFTLWKMERRIYRIELYLFKPIGSDIE
jgi:hypothetical protein